MEPTSGTAGKTAEITCTRCGEVLQAQTTIPALGYIRNVTARQLWPHKKVEVCYDVADDIGEVVDNCENAVAITATYGGTTKTAAAVRGDRSATPGHHAVAWDFEADGIAINQANVTFNVTVGNGSVGSSPTANGLSVKYYDISTSGYSTWTQSESAMQNYFASQTPTITTNTLAWGSSLSAGISEIGTTERNKMTSAGMTAESSSCRFHGKYATKSTEHFATYFEGNIQIDISGTYSFAGIADDYFVLYVDGARICNAQWSSIGTGSCSLTAGSHRISGATYEITGGQGVIIQWKKPGDSSYSPLPQSILSSLPSGLVAHYMFNGNLLDGSGNGNNLENNGASFCKDRFGNANNAVSFDGNGHYASNPDNLLAEHSFTAACWFKTSVVKSSQGSAPSSWRAGNAVLFPDHGGNDAGVGLSVGTDGLAVTEHGSNYLPTKLSYNASIGSDWNHVCMVVDNNTTVRLYLNGELVASGNLSTRSKRFKVNVGGGGWGYYTGSVDDVCIFNRAITSAEVLLIYSGTGIGEAQQVSSGAVIGSVSGIAVNTSSSVKNGMNVAGTVELGYSPFANGEVTVEIDGVAAFSSPNSGVFAWQPQTTGTHTLKHISGSYTWTRTVNVTSLAGAAPPTPNPPMAEDANIVISSTSKSFGINGGSGTIVTSGSGTWTATASDAWITIPSAMASRNAGLPVVYQIAANTDVEPRTGYIYVSGHVFTISQDGVGASLDISSADFETDGGTGSFTVLADAQSAWQVKANADWISVGGTGNGEWGTEGIGEQDVFYTVAPWNEVSTRSGTITAAGCTFTVNQTGRRMKISGSSILSGVSGLSADFDYQSHVIDIQVNALASTEWDVAVDAPWLSIVDGGGGLGGDNVAVAVNENPSYLARTGKVRIGTETLSVRQSGRPVSALSFAISPAAATASVKGANGVISVTATPDLPWTATSRANWLTVMPSFQSGAGNGNVVYSASPNPTMAARSGTITVESLELGVGSFTHTVSQPAATALVSATNHVFAAVGESFAVEVAVDDVVNWTVASPASWATIQGGASRYGPGTATVAASENLTVDPREATLTIAGHAFHALQLGRSVEVEYEARIFGTETDYATLDVHPDGNVQWKAVSSDPTWLTIWGGDGCTYDSDGNVIGVGDNTIEYIVSDYVGDGTPRTATITIGDKTVYITQRAYDLSINPSATSVGGNAGTGEVGVPAPVGAVWNAIATEPWIAIVSGYDAGTGSGTVRFTYTDNNTGAARTGRIVISGEEYTITQAARQMVSVTARVEGGKGLVGGCGSYDRGASVTLTAVANDGYEFASWTLPNGSVATGATLPVVADVDKELIATFRRIPVYDVNGESVREGTSRTFTAPEPVIDAAGTTKLVCAGTSRFPEMGTSFTLVVTEDIDFEWDLWTTNYLVTVEQTSGGQILSGGSQSPATAWLPAGSTLDLTASPDTGKSFFRWIVNGEALSTCSTRSTRLTITAPTTISAVFGVFDDTLATALDAPTLTFTTGGDTNWLPAIDATAGTGYTSARSGAIGKEAETWLDTTIEGAGTLSFRWRVDCEKDDGDGATWDRLAVFVNGVEAARIDGTTDWQTVTLPLTAPKTTVRWSFYRDDWDEPGASHENAAWVDGITFTTGEGQ